MEIIKYFKLNESVNKPYSYSQRIWSLNTNLWDVIKLLSRRKFIILNTHIRDTYNRNVERS